MIEDYVYLKKKGVFRGLTNKMKKHPISLKQIDKILSLSAVCCKMGIIYAFHIDLDYGTLGGGWVSERNSKYYVRFLIGHETHYF